MTDTNTTTNTAQGTEQAPASAPNTQQTDTPPDTGNMAPGSNANPQTQASSSQAGDQMATLLAKARREEKDKLYPEIERLKAKLEEERVAREQRTKELEERQKELEELRAGKQTELASVNRELQEQRDRTAKLEEVIQEVASDAASKIEASELASFREKSIREAGIIHLADTVSGTSRDDIEASVKQAKAREESIMEKAREEARAEMSKQLPQPISPEGSSGMSNPRVIRPQDKTNLAKLPREEWTKRRDELLAQAKAKAGLT